MTGKTLVGLLVVAALALPSAACKRIPEICETSCKQQKSCNPDFSDWYTIYECRAECEDSKESYIDDVTDDCAAAYLDYCECEAELSCAELEIHDYSKCDEASMRMSEHCDYYW